MFSNHAIEADAEIMYSALNHLRAIGGNAVNVDCISASEFRLPKSSYDLVLTMAQAPAVLTEIEALETSGTIVMNSIGSIRNCYRKPLSERLSQHNFSYPQYTFEKTDSFFNELPFESQDGYWIKRGDFHAVCDEDVVFVKDLIDMNERLHNFKSREIPFVVVQKNIPGAIVKFYGVRNNFFSHRFITPVEDKKINLEKIKMLAFEAAHVLGLDVFGGDCIVSQTGEIHFIDINDWPSFRTCNVEAGLAIAQLALSKCQAVEVLEASQCLMSEEI